VNDIWLLPSVGRDRADQSHQLTRRIDRSGRHLAPDERALQVRMTPAYNDIVMDRVLTAPTARRIAQLAAPAGACAYVLSFAIPAKTDYSLLVFAACGAIALFAADGAAVGRRSRLLAIAIACFCAVTVASLVASVDLGRSLVASSALLPGLLLFVIVGYGFSSLAEARTLLLALSVVSLGLALALIAITLRS
jgi:hypothetical protein